MCTVIIGIQKFNFLKHEDIISKVLGGNQRLCFNSQYDEYLFFVLKCALEPILAIESAYILG